MQGTVQARPQLPNAMVVMILGIVGVTVCGLCAPIAWVMGNKARGIAKSNPGAYEGEGMATAGWVMGIIGSVFLILLVLFFVIGGAIGFAAL